MPRINLLPWREAERKRKRQEFFLSIGAALATAGLVLLIGRWQMSASIEHQQERNRILSEEIAQLDKQIEEILGLENQKRRLLARMEIIEKLQRSRPEIVLRGVAQSSTRVSALMRNIDNSQWLADPSLQVVESKDRAPGGGSNFTLFATQRSQATPEDEAASEKQVAAK